MKRRVVITVTALGEVQEAFEWLAARNPSAAQRWREMLLQAIAALETGAERCPLAPEGERFGRKIQQLKIQQLLYGKRRGVYRILYEIREDVVHILRVRHGARRFLEEI